MTGANEILQHPPKATSTHRMLPEHTRINQNQPEPITIHQNPPESTKPTRTDQDPPETTRTPRTQQTLVSPTFTPGFPRIHHKFTRIVILFFVSQPGLAPSQNQTHEFLPQVICPTIHNTNHCMFPMIPVIPVTGHVTLRILTCTYRCTFILPATSWCLHCRCTRPNSSVCKGIGQDFSCYRLQALLSSCRRLLEEPRTVVREC
jgi:hypothetical protein